jgi:hypothetical protein
MRKTWSLLEGQGEAYLDLLGQKAKEWQQYGDVLPTLQTDKANLETRAANIGYDAIRFASRDGFLADIDRVVVEKLDEEEKLLIIRSFISNAAFERLERLRRGPNTLPLCSGSKVVVTAIQGGAKKQNGFIEEGHGIRVLGKPHAMQEGEVVRGIIREFDISPRRGGYLHVDTWRSTVLSGLVNPATGEPRIRLELYEKRSSPAVG